MTVNSSVQLNGSICYASKLTKFQKATGIVLSAGRHNLNGSLKNLVRLYTQNFFSCIVAIGDKLNIKFTKKFLSGITTFLYT